MVPVPSSVLVLVVVLVLVPVASVVLVLVSFVVVCAKAVLKATTLAAPTANIFVSDVCFIFVFVCLNGRIPVVLLSDFGRARFIQPF